MRRVLLGLVFLAAGCGPPTPPDGPILPGHYVYLRDATGRCLRLDTQILVSGSIGWLEVRVVPDVRCTRGDQ